MNYKTSFFQRVKFRTGMVVLLHKTGVLLSNQIKIIVVNFF